MEYKRIFNDVLNDYRRPLQVALFSLAALYTSGCGFNAFGRRFSAEKVDKTGQKNQDLWYPKPYQPEPVKQKQKKAVEAEKAQKAVQAEKASRPATLITGEDLEGMTIEAPRQQTRSPIRHEDQPD